MLLRDVMHHNSWNLGDISFTFPHSLRQRIKATPIPMSAASVDHISWCSSPNEEFDIKEAYKLACAAHDPHLFKPFMENWVWKSITLPKIKYFLWQCIHKSLPTREVLGARGLPLCNVDVESIIHILFDCPLAKEFWDSFPLPGHTTTFYGSSLTDWLRLN